jgi:hypothetical protein
MWSKLRDTVAGLVEQAGIEVPGLDAGAAALSDLAGTAETLTGNVIPEGVGGVIGAVDPTAPGEGTSP